ncbi:hypothetical protein PghCCS26_54520 [Paenibacillus glycanilyticus]|uniref:Uncharacterized protein n=1 Tax=Paenibacillus glycanilyticus TaxID=126569 RepID=A0ABQ6NVQ0_9BACL|nr:hypothetical protein PghCCS26_54520 [Paenibacillus glycanilyticus]
MNIIIQKESISIRIPARIMRTAAAADINMAKAMGIVTGIMVMTMGITGIIIILICRATRPDYLLP